MTTYAIVITAVMFFVIGVIVANTVEELYESRNRKVRKALKEKKSYNIEIGDDTDAAMDEAVALVKNELGGTVLSYEKS